MVQVQQRGEQRAVGPPPLFLGRLFLFEGEGAYEAGVPFLFNSYCPGSQQSDLREMGWKRAAIWDEMMSYGRRYR
jgi:hypothetical protein